MFYECMCVKFVILCSQMLHLFVFSIFSKCQFCTPSMTFPAIYQKLLKIEE